MPTSRLCAGDEPASAANDIGDIRTIEGHKFSALQPAKYIIIARAGREQFQLIVASRYVGHLNACIWTREPQAVSP